MIIPHSESVGILFGLTTYATSTVCGLLPAPELVTVITPEYVAGGKPVVLTEIVMSWDSGPPPEPASGLSSSHVASSLTDQV